MACPFASTEAFFCQGDCAHVIAANNPELRLAEVDPRSAAPSWSTGAVASTPAIGAAADCGFPVLPAPDHQGRGHHRPHRHLSHAALSPAAPPSGSRHPDYLNLILHQSQHSYCLLYTSDAAD